MEKTRIKVYTPYDANVIKMQFCQRPLDSKQPQKTFFSNTSIRHSKEEKNAKLQINLKYDQLPIEEKFLRFQIKYFMICTQNILTLNCESFSRLSTISFCHHICKYTNRQPISTFLKCYFIGKYFQNYLKFQLLNLFNLFFDKFSLK